MNVRLPSSVAHRCAWIASTKARCSHSPCRSARSRTNGAELGSLALTALAGAKPVASGSDVACELIELRRWVGMRANRDWQGGRSSDQQEGAADEDIFQVSSVYPSASPSLL